jgi:3-hydroxyisobutyrate dehydrogenase-like beta-hydroxyacid dehydrogenase
MDPTSDIGVIGLAVMGRNLARNLADPYFRGRPSRLLHTLWSGDRSEEST